MPSSTRPAREFAVDRLPCAVYATTADLGRAAAQEAERILQEAIRTRGVANAVFATGNSQLAFFQGLRESEEIDWSRVRLFMVDQYLGVDPDVLGTLVFLKKHLLDHVHPAEVHEVTSDPEGAEAFCASYTVLLERYPLDLATLGWGENGHLAFNDPHNADFEDPASMKVVELSERSRRQPVSEGRFASIDEVPTHAITMTIPALLAARRILCIVPEARKAEAVQRLLTEPVDETRPGSVLRRIDHAQLLLDADSSAKLDIDALARHPSA